MSDAWCVQCALASVRRLRDRYWREVERGQRLIDHIVHTKDLTLRNVGVCPKKRADDTRLSDHFGVCVDLGLG